MNDKSTNISEPLQPALGMSLCYTLADCTHETNHEEQKIKNAKRWVFLFKYCNSAITVTFLEYRSNSYCNKCFDERAKLNKLDVTHPEDFCEECGLPNPTWYAPNELWNKLCTPVEIICPKCFQKRADKAGINIVFTTEILPNK